MFRSLRVAALVALLASACGAAPAANGRHATDGRTPATPTAVPVAAAGSHDGCPITIPPQPGFVPPEPYPPEPPELYQSVWYGSADLWTILAPEGEVWRGLPEHHDGKFTQKMLWWADDLSADGEPTPIILTGRRLDQAGAMKPSTSVGASFREDIGNFMVVGIAIPAGCWELTATYGRAELSYVVAVEG